MLYFGHMSRLVMQFNENYPLYLRARRSFKRVTRRNIAHMDFPLKKRKKKKESAPFKCVPTLLLDTRNSMHTTRYRYLRSFPFTQLFFTHTKNRVIIQSKSLCPNKKIQDLTNSSPRLQTYWHFDPLKPRKVTHEERSEAIRERAPRFQVWKSPVDSPNYHAY